MESSPFPTKTNGRDVLFCAQKESRPTNSITPALDSWTSVLCLRQRILLKMKDAIDSGMNVYLVVGFRTVEDTTLVNNSTRIATREAGAGISVRPLTNSAIPVVTTANIGTQGTRGASRDNRIAFEAPDEKVFAIQYRKIKFKWFSSRKIQNASLEANNRWKICGGLRDAEENEEEEEEEDILEVNLADEGDIDSEGESYSSDNESDYFREEPLEFTDEQAGVGADTEERTDMEERTDTEKADTGETEAQPVNICTGSEFVSAGGIQGIEKENSKGATLYFLLVFAAFIFSFL